MKRKIDNELVQKVRDFYFEKNNEVLYEYDIVEIINIVLDHVDKIEIKELKLGDHFKISELTDDQYVEINNYMVDLGVNGAYDDCVDRNCWPYLGWNNLGVDVGYFDAFSNGRLLTYDDFKKIKENN